MTKPNRIIDFDERISEKLLDVRGPSQERLERAGEHFSIGGQDRGVRTYHFLDTPLDRMYARLAKLAKSENQIERLGVEYAALTKYNRLFVESGMVGSVGSVDPNRTYSPNPAGRSFLANTERQQNCRDEYRMAVIHLNNHETLGHKQTIVVDNVVNHENSLEVAGYSIGKESKTRAIVAAEAIIRDAGFRLANMWKMI